MNKYEEFKKRKIETVGDLIKKLQEFPPETTISCEGGDVGGYDVSICPYCEIVLDGNTISFGHMEYEMYGCVEKGELTYEQFKELNGETED